MASDAGVYCPLQCPMCFTPYTTQTEACPHILSCGHSACGSCTKLFGTCGVCNTEYKSGMQPVNYSLRDVIESGGQKKPKVGEFQVLCGKCSQAIDMDCARICMSCAFASDVKLDAHESEMLPFVFCPSCAIDDHLEKLHILSKYSAYKCGKLMEASADWAIKNVQNIVECFDKQWGHGRARLDKWDGAANKALKAGSTMSVRECHDLAEKCQHYGATIYEAADTVLFPALKSFVKTVEEATRNLLLDIPPSEDSLVKQQQKHKGSSGDDNVENRRGRLEESLKKLVVAVNQDLTAETPVAPISSVKQPAAKPDPFAVFAAKDDAAATAYVAPTDSTRKHTSAAKNVPAAATSAAPNTSGNKPAAQHDHLGQFVATDPFAAFLHDPAATYVAPTNSAKKPVSAAKNDPASVTYEDVDASAANFFAAYYTTAAEAALNAANNGSTSPTYSGPGPQAIALLDMTEHMRKSIKKFLFPKQK